MHDASKDRATPGQKNGEAWTHWTLTLPPGTDAEALRRAIAAAAGLDPVDVRLARSFDAVPTVVLTVHDGRAEIVAVSGAVRVIHVDLDRDAASLSAGDVEAILRPAPYTGSGEQRNVKPM